jgi:xanthine dehydrogenase YagT iron-sulfur-binding subunit
LRGTVRVKVGDPIPFVELAGLGAAPWAAQVGTPWVVAIVPAWRPRAGIELANVRAHLRGLGAALAVIAIDGVWLCAPDDALELATALTATDHARISRRYGVTPGNDAVLVVDGAGIVRYRAETGLALALDAALAAAERAMHTSSPMVFDRREWIVTSLCTGFALALLGCSNKEAPPPPPPEPKTVDEKITLRINGKQHELAVDPRTSLLDVLRERLGLTGTKKGCDMGQCGACTVHLDGMRVNSCLLLAVMADGREVTTIEGLSTGEELHPMQQAFVEHDGFQCGYCTPGQIMSACALVAEGRATTPEQIREHMSGNLCRCGAYPNIVAAIGTARARMARDR